MHGSLLPLAPIPSEEIAHHREHLTRATRLADVAITPGGGGFLLVACQRKRGDGDNWNVARVRIRPSSCLIVIDYVHVGSVRKTVTAAQSIGSAVTRSCANLDTHSCKWRIAPQRWSGSSMTCSL